ncbi:translocase of outer mitochondrial membrane 7, partial [Chelydra serpentina]
PNATPLTSVSARPRLPRAVCCGGARAGSYVLAGPLAPRLRSFKPYGRAHCSLSRAAGMPKLSKEVKQRLQQLFRGGQFAIRWGFIPVVLYLGFKRGADPGMPEPTILSLLWG